MSASSAYAGSKGLLDVTCTPPSSSSVIYDPPLTNTQQLVTSTQNAQLGPCVSTSVAALTSGSWQNTGQPRMRSCFDLLTSGPGTRTITWNTGATSTLALNRTVSVVGAVLVTTLTGTVTDGLFAGDTAVITETGAATAITLCTAGLGTVASVYSVVTLEITSI
ncbi:hypothetical protein [Streptomyces solincola]|uniref:hypothetical protein n=1 Tax=Streptomyces solincola TaxID=2100817 RepID=UPI0021598508|nr:hypothetical protein [Streptomyces solincola]